MKKLFLSNKTSAISFHMNWNSNKEEKRFFLEQMGDWYLLEPCTGDRTLAEIEAGAGAPRGNLTVTCCSATPLYKCHYRDKPSLRPCESDRRYQPKSKKSFW